MKFRKSSFLGLVGFCCFAAFAVALSFAVVFTGVAAAVGQSDAVQAPEQAAQPAESSEPPANGAKQFTGMVTDAHCGPRHTMNSDKTAAECVRMCARNGQAYTLVDGDKHYALVGGDERQLDAMAGQRATVSGTVDGDSIRVKTISAEVFTADRR